MKKFSKLLALTLVCVMLLGAISTGASAIFGNNPGNPWVDSDLDDTNTAIPISAQVFDDVAPGSWYYEAVNNMAQGGLLYGYSDGLFHPSDPITYGQFASILCRVCGITTESDGRLDGKEGGDHWSAYAIQNILQTMIFERNYKYADEILWRAEALEAMANMTIHMPKYGYSYDTQITDKVWTWNYIPDADDVQDWNHGTHRWTWPVVLCAYNLGITTGVDTAGTCNPTGTVTRAQLCQMLYNMGISEANSVTVRSGGGIF